MEKQPPKVKSQSESVFENELAKFCQIFPQFVSEGKIDFVAFQKFLQQNKAEINNQDRYNFSWAGKMQSFHAIQQPCFATLTPQKEQSVNFAKSRNLFIEGDNLEVLKLLQNNYRNQIKMIYIDPPYNTGKDFIYKDNFKQNRNDYFERIGVSNGGIKLETNSDANGRFHSDWLSMIYPRLFLAKQLLREDGVIFVSIDDNEQHHLRILMNEIFGEENFLGNFIINSTPNARDYGHIGKMHEFVIFYAKNILEAKTDLIPNRNNKFKYSDEQGGFNIHPLYNSNVAFTPKNRPNLYYPFYIYLDKKIEKNANFFEIGLEKKTNSIEIFPPKSIKDNVQFVWRWGQDTARENLNKEIIGYKIEDEYRIVQKMRHDSKVIRSIQLDKSVTNRRGTAEVEKLFDGKIFLFPKPIQLIKNFLIAGTKEEDIVLDFFAGSGTTGHAVMDLNKEDGGNRQFILVQIPEKIDKKSEAYKAGYKNIAKIGIERLKRAIAKNDYKDGFKLFTLTPSNYNISQAYKGTDAKELLKQERLFSENPLVKNYQPENLVYEILLKNNFSLHSIIQQQGDFWIVTDEENEQKIYLILADKIDEQALKDLKLDKAKDLLICLDKILDDTLKQNLHRDYNLKTI